MSQPKPVSPAYQDKETMYNAKVSGKSYYVMMHGKLMAANPTYDGALRTARVLGPEAVVQARGKKKKIGRAHV